jgi:hypothetical protein
MMWLETNSKNTPSQTLVEACQYFTDKYGRLPTHARVPINWPDLTGNTPAGMQVEHARNILPHHVHLAADPEMVKAVCATTLETAKTEANIALPQVASDINLVAAPVEHSGGGEITIIFGEPV